MHLLDRLFGLVSPREKFFVDGWGDPAVLPSDAPVELARLRPARIGLRLTPIGRVRGGRLLEGHFESPEPRLPPAARTARVRLLVPPGKARGIAVHLAASGDEGFRFRQLLAAPLLARGIGALILENPFYGSRRPPGQPTYAVRCVSDLQLMAAATVQEARALLRWLRETGAAPLLGVTGYSMGGQLAAMVGQATRFPLAVVPVAPSCSPVSVFEEGVLREVARWSALGPGPEEARRALCRHLSRFSVKALPPPRAPEAAIVVGTAEDGVVPPAEMRKIADHWGCELRWLPAGHVSAVLLHREAIRQAIADAFERLERGRHAGPGPSGRRRPMKNGERRAGLFERGSVRRSPRIAL
ncbi:MAG: alpha/beta hydrolase family protein [Anaeromyxobacter sp.]